MEAAYRIALVGFSSAETSTFESFFRLAARRLPAYHVQDEVMDARVLIVNADDPQAMHLVRYAGLSGQVLLIGRSDAGTGWPIQHRPVKLVAVLSTLDRMLGVLRPVAAPAPAVSNGFAATVPVGSSQLQALGASMRQAGGRRRSVDGDADFPPTRPMLRARAAQRPAGVVRLDEAGADDEQPVRISATHRPHPAGSGADVPEPERGDMLLVAQSLVEGRILLKRFRKYGLKADWSREPSQALVMMKAHPYRLVVVDRLTGAPDAHEVCRSAKKSQGPKGSPVVIMFTHVTGSMERMRATLAGCDAHLSRSVNESDLYKVLADHRLVSLNGFAPTNIGNF